jgi:D-sedoheptulose 7-phosphate isomerase
VSRLRPDDAILVFSVGGGDRERNVSPNLVAALEYAREVGATIVGIVGRDGGYTAKVADACVIIPTVNHAHVTPHSEAFQGVVWHLLVTHPALKAAATKWEAVAARPV